MVTATDEQTVEQQLDSALERWAQATQATLISTNQRGNEVDRTRQVLASVERLEEQITDLIEQDNTDLTKVDQSRLEQFSALSSQDFDVKRQHIAGDNLVETVISDIGKLDEVLDQNVPSGSGHRGKNERNAFNRTEENLETSIVQNIENLVKSGTLSLSELETIAKAGDALDGADRLNKNTAKVFDNADKAIASAKERMEAAQTETQQDNPQETEPTGQNQNQTQLVSNNDNTPQSDKVTEQLTFKYSGPGYDVTGIGYEGEDFKQVQEFLEKEGYYSEEKLGKKINYDPVDGDFGTDTKSAIEAFQRDQGLTGKDVDGIIGETTLAKMNEVIKENAIEAAKPKETKVQTPANEVENNNIEEPGATPNQPEQLVVRGNSK